MTEPLGNELTASDPHPLLAKGNSPEGVSAREAKTSLATSSNIESGRLCPDHDTLFPEFEKKFIADSGITGTAGVDFTCVGLSAAPAPTRIKSPAAPGMT